METIADCLFKIRSLQTELLICKDENTRLQFVINGYSLEQDMVLELLLNYPHNCNDNMIYNGADSEMCCAVCDILADVIVSLKTKIINNHEGGKMKTVETSKEVATEFNRLHEIITRLSASLEDLTLWMQTHTSPKDGTLEMLQKSVEVLAEVEAEYLDRLASAGQ